MSGLVQLVTRPPSPLKAYFTRFTLFGVGCGQLRERYKPPIDKQTQHTFNNLVDHKRNLS